MTPTRAGSCRLVAALVIGASSAALAQAKAGGAAPPPTFVERLETARAIVSDSARRLALDAVASDVLREVEATERRVLGVLRSTTSRSADSTVIRRYGAARDGLSALLAALEAEGSWGTRRFATLRAVYPESPMLIEAAAQRAAAAGARDTAIALFDRLLRREPSNVGWQRTRAALLAQLGRRDAAARAYAVALDLEPEDEPTFRSALQLATSDDALAILLRQIRRHRLALPNSRPISEREVEMLQRLGWLDDAARAAEALRRRPT